MKKIIGIITSTLLVSSAFAYEGAELDRKTFQKYYTEKLNVPMEEFKNGAYAYGGDIRTQWEAEEEFPRYLEIVEKGEVLWNTPFANGKTYASCYEGKEVSDIRPAYPHWDSEKKTVATLEGSLNACRKANGEKALKWKKGAITHLGAYLGYEARGKKIVATVPNEPEAIAAYEDGKKTYFTKRGQLNFACADCHFKYAKSMIRADQLSPTLGHTTHFPVFRGKWSGPGKDGMGTLHRRFAGCNKQVRAEPLKAQSETYKNLEFFLANIDNGLEINAPGYRK